MHGCPLYARGSPYGPTGAATIAGLGPDGASAGWALAGTGPGDRSGGRTAPSPAHPLPARTANGTRQACAAWHPGSLRAAIQSPGFCRCLAPAAPAHGARAARGVPPPHRCSGVVRRPHPLEGPGGAAVAAAPGPDRRTRLRGRPDPFSPRATCHLVHPQGTSDRRRHLGPERGPPPVTFGSEQGRGRRRPPPGRGSRRDRSRPRNRLGACTPRAPATPAPPVPPPPGPRRPGATAPPPP